VQPLLVDVIQEEDVVVQQLVELDMDPKPPRQRERHLATLLFPSSTNSTIPEDDTSNSPRTYDPVRTGGRNASVFLLSSFFILPC
ncbi:MAG: hypothetical protein AAF402_16060, partial [Pseudomonadota bacterium]